MYFSKIESLKDIVILSPPWLARQYYCKRGQGFDKDWQQLTNHGILHESPLRYMLDKFLSEADRGETFMVPSLKKESSKHQETSIFSQLIADCICRNMERIEMLIVVVS